MKSTHQLFSFAAAFGLAVGAFGASPLPARPAPADVSLADKATPPNDGAQPVVSWSLRNDTSPALTDMVKAADALSALRLNLPRLTASSARTQAQAGDVPDPVVQSDAGADSMPAPILSWDGVGNIAGYIPSDANGDVGKDHYFQWTNVFFAIYTKTTGALALGPKPGNFLWGGFGGPCETTNDGDPIALYDQLAERWFASQFALPNIDPSGQGPFYQCIAVSASSNPLGQWYRYVYTYSTNVLNDYPKWGVWPDAYYMSANDFLAPSFAPYGASALAFERDKMLLGLPARVVRMNLRTVNSQFVNLLPSDLDGMTPPPAGAPNTFAAVADPTITSTTFLSTSMRLWDFHVDWTNPASSTFGIAGNPNVTLSIAAWTPMPCTLLTGVASYNCVPQPSTSVKLDVIGDRLMHRLAYRNLDGAQPTLVVNHSVNAGGGRAGVRWYELRKDGADWAVHQQSTFAPDDGVFRWMGSAAMDGAGNIAVGYSASSEAVFPDIRYAGRMVNDPLNDLAQGEQVMWPGGGSQTDPAQRWGDYTMMTVDPYDDCTFYYTNQYQQTTSARGWRTRIGTFRFPNCGVVAFSYAEDGNSNLNGYVEPGEGAILTVTLRNLTSATLTQVSGVNAIVAGSATFTNATSTYPDLGPGADAANLAPFTMWISSGQTCGVGVGVVFTATFQPSGALNGVVEIPIGGPGATTMFTTTPFVPIPDNTLAGVTSTLPISMSGKVYDVRVRLDNITHTYDSDLVITLISPDGTRVALVRDAGSNGQNFVDTVLDDDAPTEITQGAAPFTGSYRPVERLSQLRGQTLGGAWKLNVADTAGEDVGTLYQWGLNVRAFVCLPNPLPITPRAFLPNVAVMNALGR